MASYSKVDEVKKSSKESSFITYPSSYPSSSSSTIVEEGESHIIDEEKRLWLGNLDPKLTE